MGETLHLNEWLIGVLNRPTKILSTITSTSLHNFHESNITHTNIYLDDFSPAHFGRNMEGSVAVVQFRFMDQYDTSMLQKDLMYRVNTHSTQMHTTCAHTWPHTNTQFKLPTNYWQYKQCSRTSAVLVTTCTDIVNPIYANFKLCSIHSMVNLKMEVHRKNHNVLTLCGVFPAKKGKTMWGTLLSLRNW